MQAPHLLPGIKTYRLVKGDGKSFYDFKRALPLEVFRSVISNIYQPFSSSHIFFFFAKSISYSLLLCCLHCVSFTLQSGGKYYEMYVPVSQRIAYGSPRLLQNTGTAEINLDAFKGDLLYQQTTINYKKCALFS